ncbi:MAG: geranylgeranylglycerol-phosphate geranylgeranyltransferase [Bacteroidales bacterium]
MEKRSMSKNWMAAIRFPNLVMVIVAMLAANYFILLSGFHTHKVYGELPWYILIPLILATVFIAAGGNLYNDLMDEDIDSVNHKNRSKFRGLFKKDLEIAYLVFSLLGLFFGGLASFLVHKVNMGLIFILCLGLLRFYSNSLKRKMFWGNFVVSVLTALPILLIWVFDFLYLSHNRGDLFVEAGVALSLNFRLIVVYAIFAFLASMLREVVKDMEDIEGDAKCGARTLPIVKGIHFCRIYFVGFWLLLVGWVFLAYELLSSYNLWINIMIFGLGTLLTAAFAIPYIFKADNKKEYHRLSTFLKIFMGIGLLSMLLTPLNGLF